MRPLRNIALVLATGYIFVFFSEHLFWARVRPDDSLPGWIMTWGVYSLLAFAFLTLITTFRIRDIWALFLAGAAVGWLAEGLVVQTAYESLPLSLSFTGLAWHALITIWAGWYGVMTALRAKSGLRVLWVAALMGLVYGLWAIAWWSEPDGGVATVGGFAAFSVITTVLAAAAFALSGWAIREPFRPPRGLVIAIGGIFALYFLFVTIPAAPIAALLLPLLLGLVYVALRKNRAANDEGSLLSDLDGPVPPARYFALLALPAMAVGVYALALALDLRWRTNWALYLITTPAGFVLFGVSWGKMMRKWMTSHKETL